MSELDDRLIEGRATVTTMDPPDDLWARALERSNNDDVAILDLTTPHRRSASLWLAVAAVTALLAIVGALALLDDHQTVDTTPVTEGPELPEREDQAMADAAALTPDDMPASWEPAPAEVEEQWETDAGNRDQAFADCLGIDVSVLPNDSPTAHSAFVHSSEANDERVVSDVTVFASEAEAHEVIDRFRDDAAQRCYLDVVEQQIAEGAHDRLTTISGRELSGDNIEVGESTITEWRMEYIDAPAPCPTSGPCPGYRPIGDESVVLRVNVPLTSEGIEVDVFATYAFARKGTVVVQTSTQAYFTRFSSDGASTEGLTTTVVDRITPGAPIVGP